MAKRELSKAVQMDNLIEEFSAVVRRCEPAAQPFTSGPVHDQIQRLRDAIRDIDQAWSGSWFGYQASLYINGLRPRQPDEHYDSQWGNHPLGDTRGPWVDYSYDEIMNAITARASVPDLSRIEDSGTEARNAIRWAKERLLPLLDALLSAGDDEALRSIRDEINKVEGMTRETWIIGKRPRTFMSNDRIALNQFLQGCTPPPHIGFEAWLMSQMSLGYQVGEVARLARRAEQYLSYREKMRQGGMMTQTDKKIFIGHGHSPVWRELADFIQNTLHLQPDEFNRQPVAGLTTVERLEIMLDHAAMAILVMTAEDEHADATYHARENVIHEAGLFQGHLGFKRAIMLLEEGCEEFSNVHGLSHIRFPKGNIRACFEDIRQVLQRENIL